MPIMDTYLVAIAAYALAAFLVRLFMAVEFARSPASASRYAALSNPMRAFFWLIAVPSFSAFPVLSFLSGYRVLAALFVLFTPLALLWFKGALTSEEPKAGLAQA